MAKQAQNTGTHDDDERVQDRSDIDDLTNLISRLSTENGSPASKDRTTPTGGASCANQSKPQDSTKMVGRTESTRQVEQIPKLRLSKVEGKWTHKPYRLACRTGTECRSGERL